MSERAKRPWHLRYPDPATPNALSRAIGVSPVVAQLLVNRDLADPAAARWLDVPLHDLPSIDAVPGATEAGHLLAAAAAKVCVYGDYDMDGTTGSVTLYRTLGSPRCRRSGVHPPPARRGLWFERGGRVADRRCRVHALSTVDCVIASPAEIALARPLGVAVVTDHQPKAVLPVLGPMGQDVRGLRRQPCRVSERGSAG